MVFDGIKFVWGVISPFVLGGVIAFIVNIPMRFFEEKLFDKAKVKKKKWAEKLARPLSLILALLLIIGIIATVVLIVIPELGNTLLNLGKTIQDFIPKAQEWAIQTFKDNQEIAKWIADIDFKWNEILSQGLDFLKMERAVYLALRLRPP